MDEALSKTPSPRDRAKMRKLSIRLGFILAGATVLGLVWFATQFAVYCREQRAVAAIQERSYLPVQVRYKSSSLLAYVLPTRVAHVLDRVVELDLGGTQLENGDIRILAAFQSLERLSLGDANGWRYGPAVSVGERGAVAVGALKSLRVLRLNGTDISDDALMNLASLNDLRELDLSDTAITDKGLSVLANMPALESLSLRHT